jgi:hypothetical protein
MKLRAGRNFFCAAAVALVASCASDTSGERQVRELVTRAEEYAEARDGLALAALISDDYLDDRGFDKHKLAYALQDYFLDHPSVNLLVRIDSLEFPEGNHAVAQITFGMLRRRGTSEENWELAADLETLEVEFLDESGEWRVIRADRKRSP